MSIIRFSLTRQLIRTFTAFSFPIVGAALFLCCCMQQAVAQDGIDEARSGTRITGPLNSDGTIDYAKAINERLGKGVTPENNSNVLLWQAHGPHPEQATMAPEFFELMGMEAPAEKGDYFVDFGTFLKNRGIAQENLNAFYDRQGNAFDHPWRAADFPELADWLKANEAPLALVSKAVKRERYYSPVFVPAEKEGEPSFGLVGVLLPAVQSSRSFARALVARAMLHVANEDYEAAWQDLLTCQRLGRQVGQGATLIEGLVGIAIHGVAVHTTFSFIEQTQPDAQLVARYQRDLNELGELPDMAEKVDLAERSMFLDLTQRLSGGNTDIMSMIGEASLGKAAEKLFKQFLTTAVDWDSVSELGNQWYDRIVEILREKDQKKVSEKLSDLNIQLLKLKEDTLSPWKMALLLVVAKEEGAKEAGKAIGNVLVALLLPAVEACQNAEIRAAQQLSLLHIAFALSAYHADHDRYPIELAQLMPKYLPEIPRDEFTGDDLHYRTKDPGYIVYSFGRNQQDDGGNFFDDTPSGDDIGVRMPIEKPND
jgi:hypothetical protein